MRESRKLPPVRWKLHLAATPTAVFDLLTTDAGRERFWAERSATRGKTFTLTFPGKEKVRCPIIKNISPRFFAFRYFDGTLVEFSLKQTRRGGTELELTEAGHRTKAHRTENHAGWIQVLLCLKAAADHGVDLRNHDSRRTWSHGYCEN